MINMHDEITERSAISLYDQIEADVKKLGIEYRTKFTDASEWDEFDKPPYSMLIIFKTEEDRNLYRLIGKWTESWWLKFQLESDQE